ncbi:hypothetical protein F383_16671 [Gossypium arboreum]|uniref:Uncharacterized protein n=1 Tax=Gossypium arboreum TaxID=29729 RepID=A0A0B0MAK9_GOSAR|nr:hypothetical protein F383_16671 [Gossypium arboreum]
MQELDQNSNLSDMSLISYEFIRFERGLVTINLYHIGTHDPIISISQLYTYISNKYKYLKF